MGKFLQNASTKSRKFKLSKATALSYDRGLTLPVNASASCLRCDDYTSQGALDHDKGQMSAFLEAPSPLRFLGLSSGSLSVSGFSVCLLAVAMAPNDSGWAALRKILSLLWLGYVQFSPNIASFVPSPLLHYHEFQQICSHRL